MIRLKAGPSLAASVAGALLMSGAVLAGTKLHFPVLVDPARSLAVGSIGSTRNGGDTVQLLGCKATADSSGAWGFCVARDQQGVIGSCSTDDPNMLATIRGLSGDSIVQFQWDTFGTCTLVSLFNGSEAEPKR